MAKIANKNELGIFECVSIVIATQQILKALTSLNLQSDKFMVTVARQSSIHFLQLVYIPPQPISL